MSWDKIGIFQVDQATTRQFALASGDCNPLHVDPVLARRYQFGSTVIHGVCGVLKALDLLLKCMGPVSLASIKVQFSKPVLHTDSVEVYSQQLTEHGLKLRLFVRGKRVQDIDLVFSEKSDTTPEVAKYRSTSEDMPQPRDLQFEDADTFEDKFKLSWDPELIQSLFPSVKKFLPDNQTAILLGLTNIVGMQCPGLHSVFAGFDVRFVQNASVSDEGLHFKILRNDNRFSMITIGIFHNTANGEITALFRPKPVAQEKYTELQLLVANNQFANQNALIIGGSRGVGEVTAKLIAAGGGHVVMTYFQGKEEAERIVDEIRSHGGKCDAIACNVINTSETDIIKYSPEKPFTHIYYFASPLIEKGDHMIWDDAVFEKFYRYYIGGFARIIGQFLADATYSKNHVTVFVPSTIFLDQPQKGFSEYIAAKAAVETLLRQLAVKLPNWDFHAPRLPRMLTDQTSGLNAALTQRTAEVMLDTLISLDRISINNDK